MARDYYVAMPELLLDARHEAPLMMLHILRLIGAEACAATLFAASSLHTYMG